jgi:hypothetical protein
MTGAAIEGLNYMIYLVLLIFTLSGCVFMHDYFCSFGSIFCRTYQ